MAVQELQVAESAGAVQSCVGYICWMARRTGAADGKELG